MKQLLSSLLFLFLTTVQSQQIDYEIHNTSVNSSFAELGVIYLNSNEVLFASSKKTENDKAFAKNRRKNNRQLFLDFYQGTITENGDILQTKKFSNEINNRFFECDIAFTPDFKTIYFTWNTYFSPQSRKDLPEQKSLNLFRASIDENFELSNITPMPFNSKNYTVKSPKVSKDGKQLYLVSDMPNGYGGFDIYVVDIYKNGSTSWPKNLGANINTNKSELFPFISENNTLYFSSYGHNGKGNLDIFKSEFVDGEFQKVENLASPINSKFDDFAFVIDDATNTGFFTSNRDGGKGDVDIYSFKVKGAEQECKQTIIVNILNIKDELPLENVLVSLYMNNKLITTQPTRNEATISFELECSKSYKIVAEKENFNSAEYEFKTTSKNKELISKTILLTALECKQVFAGVVTEEETNLPITNSIVLLFQNDKLLETKTLTTGNKFSFDLDCNKSYTIVTEKENYSTLKIAIETDSNLDRNISKNIVLTPFVCAQLVTGTITDKTTNEPLHYSTISLFKNEKLIETKNLSNESNFNFNLNCNSSYTIVAEKENYNSSKIILKTDANYDSKISKNIELAPLKCTQIVTGTITEKGTNTPLYYATVSLFHNNNLIETKTLSNGYQFEFELNCNESYKIITEKENYSKSEIIVETDAKFIGKISKSIVLEPLKCVQLISGQVLDIKTKKQLAEAIVKLYKEDVLIDTIALDTNASFSYKLECSSNYSIIATSKSYSNSTYKVSTSNKFNETLNNTFLLEHSIEFITVREQKMIHTNPIYFDLDESNIRNDAAIELDKVVEILYKYPSIKIEIKSHTDSRAPDDYNMSLSNTRAQSTINYIISKGVDASRVSGKGYGETQLINKCSNGVQCTKDEHQMNRRTEFIVIEN